MEKGDNIKAKFIKKKDGKIYLIYKGEKKEIKTDIPFKDLHLHTKEILSGVKQKNKKKETKKAKKKASRKGSRKARTLYEKDLVSTPTFANKIKKIKAEEEEIQRRSEIEKEKEYKELKRIRAEKEKEIIELKKKQYQMIPFVNNTGGIPELKQQQPVIVKLLNNVEDSIKKISDEKETLLRLKNVENENNRTIKLLETIKESYEQIEKTGREEDLIEFKKYIGGYVIDAESEKRAQEILIREIGKGNIKIDELREKVDELEDIARSAGIKINKKEKKENYDDDVIDLDIVSTVSNTLDDFKDIQLRLKNTNEQLEEKRIEAEKIKSKILEEARQTVELKDLEVTIENEKDEEIRSLKEEIEREKKEKEEIEEQARKQKEEQVRKQKEEQNKKEKIEKGKKPVRKQEKEERDYDKEYEEKLRENKKILKESIVDADGDIKYYRKIYNLFDFENKIPEGTRKNYSAKTYIHKLEGTDKNKGALDMQEKYNRDRFRRLSDEEKEELLDMLNKENDIFSGQKYLEERRNKQIEEETLRLKSKIKESKEKNKEDLISEIDEDVSSEISQNVKNRNPKTSGESSRVFKEEHDKAMKDILNKVDKTIKRTSDKSKYNTGDINDVFKADGGSSKYTEKEKEYDSDDVVEEEEESFEYPPEDENIKQEKQILQNELNQLEGTGLMKGGLFGNEINDMMKKYNKSGFSGVIPRDYVDTLTKKPYQGFIMNLDKSNKNGSHWVAVIIDNKKHQIIYYDSFGEEPGKDFIKSIKHLIDNTPYQYKINRIKRQSASSTNCGYFGMKFLKDMMDGKKFSEATGFDKLMNMLDQSKTGEKEIEIFKDKITQFNNVIPKN